MSNGRLIPQTGKIAYRFFVLFIVFFVFLNFHQWITIFFFRQMLQHGHYSIGVRTIEVWKSLLAFQVYTSLLNAAVFAFIVLLIIRLWTGNTEKQLTNLAAKVLTLIANQPQLGNDPVNMLPPKDPLKTVDRVIDDLIKKQSELNEKVSRIKTELAEYEKAITVGLLASSIVHEMSSPLSAMKGYLKGIQTTADGESVSMFVSKCNDIIKGMERLIEDLRHLARAGNPRAEEIFRPSEVVGKVLDNPVLQERATVKKCRIKTSVSCDARIKGDPDLLYRVVFNIIDNAIHAVGEGGLIEAEVRDTIFTEPGSESTNWFSPEVNLERMRIGEGEPVVLITIKDNGAGIPWTTMKNIFQPFYTTKEGEQGTGLGLYVVKQAMTHLRGRIFVRSLENKGTEFRLYIPMAEEGTPGKPFKEEGIGEDA